MMNKGIGFDNLPEWRAYKVIHGSMKKYFIQLSKARKYYNSIPGEKSIWDEDTLIDCVVINVPKVF